MQETNSGINQSSSVLFNSSPSSISSSSSSTSSSYTSMSSSNKKSQKEQDLKNQKSIIESLKIQYLPKLSFIKLIKYSQINIGEFIKNKIVDSNVKYK